MDLYSAARRLSEPFRFTKREAAEARGSYHRRERWSGEFSRSLTLPPAVDPSKAKASYEHGVLSLRVPCREEAKPRQIPVQGQERSEA